MHLTNKIALPGFVFDPEHLELWDASGARIALRPRTLGVLQCLAGKAGHVVSKDELMRTAWPDVMVTDDSLVQCIGELRRALNDADRQVVQTEARRGYRLLVSAPTHPVNGAKANVSSHPEEFHQQIRFATSADGVRIAYATSGHGPPLVRTAQWMTHLEWDWRSSVFGDFIRRLSSSHRLVRYDARGCGHSDRGMPMTTLDDEVRDLEAVVDAAGLDQFSIFARSQGGAVAVRYAAQHPERVSRLVILGGFVRGKLRRGEKSTQSDEVAADCRLVEGGWGDVNSAFRQMWTRVAFPDGTAEQHDSYNHLQLVSSSPQDAANIFRMMCDYDASADLDRVECPTLVLHCPGDRLVPFEEGRLIASKIKGARLEPVDSRNHVPLPGEPAFETVARRIAEFLDDSATMRPPRQTMEPAKPALLRSVP